MSYLIILITVACAGEGKPLAAATDKMKNLAAKRDSMRKSFIEEQAAAKGMAPVSEVNGEEDDLSSYL